MSKYTADEVAAMAAKYNYPSDAIGYRHNKLYEMLVEHERRLRQEDEESRRDPVMEPKSGDRVEVDGECLTFSAGREMCTADAETWAATCSIKGATIIRRREVQQ